MPQAVTAHSANTSRRRFLAGLPLAGTAIGLSAPALAAPDADAALLALGHDLDAAWKAEGLAAGEDDQEAAFDRSSAIVGRIEVLAAKTMAGVKVKCRAFHWCYADDLDDPLFVPPAETTDLRLALGIVRDLIKL